MKRQQRSATAVCFCVLAVAALDGVSQAVGPTVNVKKEIYGTAQVLKYEAGDDLDQENVLLEADVAELADGRVLIVWRITKSRDGNAHKWFSVSSDGGMTFSEPRIFG